MKLGVRASKRMRCKNVIFLSIYRTKMRDTNKLTSKSVCFFD